jgi:hypothetical protein
MKRTNIFLFFLHSYCFLFSCAFVFSHGIHENSPVFLEFSTAIALAVFGVYNAHRLLKFHQSKLTIEMSAWLSKNLLAIRSFVVFGLALSCVLFIHIFSLFSSAIFLLGITLLLSAFYSGLFSYFILREIPFLKALLVTISWFIVLVYISKSYGHNFQYIDFSFLILFYALTLPSDLKDIKFDPASFKTIPQLIGSKKSLFLFNVLMALFLLLNCINGRLNLFYSISILLFLILLTRYYLLKSSSFRLELFDFSLVLVGLGFLFSAKF